jgi:broad specificity phosphatase PhoE
MRLYLIRHAHTLQDRNTDSNQWRLSERGVAQAQQLAQQPFWQAVTQLVLSSEPKTRLTVEPLLAQRPLPVLVDRRFDELRRGGWISAEQYLAQVQQAFAHPYQAVSDWESADQALQRVRSGIEALVQRFPTATLALVGHGLTLSLYRADLLGQRTVHFADWQQLPFAAVALVDPVRGQLLQDFT